MNSDDNFSVFRRFGQLRTRLLLHKQWEVARLERELEDLDQEDARDDVLRIQSLDYDRKEGISERERLMGRIDEKLKAYGMLLLPRLLHGD